MPETKRRKALQDELIETVNQLAENWVEAGKEEGLTIEQIVDGTIFSIFYCLDQQYHLQSDDMQKLSLSGPLHKLWAIKTKKNREHKKEAETKRH